MILPSRMKNGQERVLRIYIILKRLIFSTNGRTMFCFNNNENSNNNNNNNNNNEHCEYHIGLVKTESGFIVS